MSAITSLNLKVPWIMHQFSGYRSFSILRSSVNQKIGDGDQEFRVFDLVPKKANFGRKRLPPRKPALPPLPPRSSRMPVDQDWSSVWPVARVFHPATVPLPLNQGWVESGKTPPGSFANAELMKIPNFLHLTPPAIKKHCDALKRFCTEWPKDLKTENQMQQHFPLQFSSSDYCHSSPSIRDVRARIVTLQVKLSSLSLDEHAKDKLLRLVKERYDPSTDVLTIVADRCPLRKQNKDYALYLLNVLVSESWKNEPWENEKSEEDMEKYVWEGSPSQRSVARFFDQLSSANVEPAKPEVVAKYAEVVTRLHNEGEDMAQINAYKESVKALLGKKGNVKLE